MNIHHVAISLLAFAASACAGVPRLDIVPEDGEPRSEVALIVREVACEIAASPDFATLRTAGYVVSANIQIKARENSGLAPSLSFINPLNTPTTSQTDVLNGSLSRGGTRQFNQTLLLSVAEMQPMTLSDCPSARTTSGLTGDIGLRDIIAAAFASSATGIEGTHFVSGAGGRSINPAFGTTIEFVFERSINGGPTWSRVRFRGPNGGNGATGLVSAGRTDTSTLVIAFVPTIITDRATTWSDEERANAERQSQALLTQLILQNATFAR